MLGIRMIAPPFWLPVIRAVNYYSITTQMQITCLGYSHLLHTSLTLWNIKWNFEGMCIIMGQYIISKKHYSGLLFSWIICPITKVSIPSPTPQPFWISKQSLIVVCILLREYIRTKNSISCTSAFLNICAPVRQSRWRSYSNHIVIHLSVHLSVRLDFVSNQ